MRRLLVKTGGRNGRWFGGSVFRCVPPPPPRERAQLATRQQHLEDFRIGSDPNLSNVLISSSIVPTH